MFHRARARARATRARARLLNWSTHILKQQVDLQKQIAEVECVFWNFEAEM